MYRKRHRTRSRTTLNSTSYVLDSLPAAAAYSVRKLRSTYAGNCLRVRRSSDNAEIDVGFAKVGANLATNGDFSNGGTGWTLSSASVSGGVLNVSGGANFMYQQMGLVQGRQYWFSFNYTCSVGANLRISNSNINGASIVYNRNTLGGTSGKIQGGFIASSTTGFFSIEADAQTFTGTIDNVVVREVGGVGDDLNLYALTNFLCPSGATQASLPSGFISIWYDQSLNTRNATQPTAASQPRIINAGALEVINNRPAITQDGVDKNLGVTFAHTGANYTISTVHKFMNQTTSFYNLLYALETGLGGDSNLIATCRAANSNATWEFPTSSYGGNAQALDASYVRSTIKSTAGIQTFLNGAVGLVANDAPALASYAITSLTLMNRVANNLGWSAPVSEFILFTSDLNSTNRSTIERDQGAYYNIAVA
jgi:hypothetical protein